MYNITFNIKAGMRNTLKAIIVVLGATFGISTSQAQEPILNGYTPDIPVFPQSGNIESDVVIEYYYNSACSVCANASGDIYKMLSVGIDIKVIFRPLPIDQTTYSNALSEIALFTKGQGYFERLHFAHMATVLKSEKIPMEAVEKFVIQAANLEERKVLNDVLRNKSIWKLSIEENHKAATALEIKKLPVFVINSVKYEGYPGYEKMLKTIAATRLERQKDKGTENE